MVNSPLIRPYFLGGGGMGGVRLDSHESNSPGPALVIFFSAALLAAVKARYLDPCRLAG